MLYTAFIWTDVSSQADVELADYDTFTTTAVEAGVMAGGHELHSPDIATTIRFRDDEVLMTDGPFVDSKEQITGYYLFECANLDEAIAWAAKIPGARHGAIEVRPVQERSDGSTESAQ